LGRLSLLAMRFISLRAWVRLRWVLSLLLVRRCHFLRRYWRSCSSGVSLRPVASWFCQLMVVLRPLSWMVRVRGAPTRVSFSCWSRSNALHSGPWSMRLSATTAPHSVQMISPVSLSVMSLVDPHSSHVLRCRTAAMRIRVVVGWQGFYCCVCGFVLQYYFFGLGGLRVCHWLCVIPGGFCYLF